MRYTVFTFHDINSFLTEKCFIVNTKLLIRFVVYVVVLDI